MTEFHVGCAGWDYKDWIGPFYPKQLDHEKFLGYYSQFFDFIEINSTFYNLPREQTLTNWYKRVPETFKFAVKVWKDITHNLGDPDLDLRLSEFFMRMKPLSDKIVGYLFQFPPWFKNSEKHLRNLRNLMNNLPTKKKVFIELRDISWFHPHDLAKFANESDVIFVSSYLGDDTKAFYLPDQDLYYIRLIGDRELTVFNRIQRSQEAVLNDLYEKMDSLLKTHEPYEIFIIVNNHFSGFAPEAANYIKKILNIESKEFSQQTKLSDFF